LKFGIFEKSKRATAAILKIEKTAISQQQFDQSRNLHSGSLNRLAVNIFEFYKSKMATGCHFENPSACVMISTTIRPIVVISKSINYWVAWLPSG